MALIFWGNAYNKAHPYRAWHKKAGIYSIEDKKGVTICLCDTYEDEKQIKVKHIESKKEICINTQDKTYLQCLLRKYLKAIEVVYI